MDINTPALPPMLIHNLRRSGRILPACNCRDLQDQELQSLERLRLKSQLLTTKLGYLNAYDRLFRYVSLALLAQGYRLTDKQPHQTLRAVAELQLDALHVTQMIALRHQLKKLRKLMLSNHALTRWLSFWQVMKALTRKLAKMPKH